MKAVDVEGDVRSGCALRVGLSSTSYGLGRLDRLMVPFSVVVKRDDVGCARSPASLVAMTAEPLDVYAVPAERLSGTASSAERADASLNGCSPHVIACGSF